MTKDGVKLAYKVSAVTLSVNFFLTIFKLLAGIFGHSIAMISDAVHSGSDVLSTLVVIIGIKISSKKSDKNHQFGHERFESVAAIILAVALGATGIIIGIEGIKNIIKPEAVNNIGLIAAMAAVASIIIKEIMYHYTKNAANKTQSSALLADAWHHRSDAFSSIGSLVGIIGAMLGIRILDPIASIIICLLIVKASTKIFIEAIRKMTDEACPEDFERKLIETILCIKEIKNIDSLKTRKFGNRIYAEIEISLDESLLFVDAHKIVEDLHTKIETEYPAVKHVSIHYNPVQSLNQTFKNLNEISKPHKILRLYTGKLPKFKSFHK